MAKISFNKEGFMTKQKKLGSVSNLPKGKKKPFWDRIWDYKPYMIVGIIIILLIIIYFAILKNIDRNPEINPTPTVSQEKAPDTGTLEVITEPSGARIQFKNKFQMAPTTFENIPEGEHIIILSMPGYRTVEKTVTIEKDSTTTFEYQMER